MPSRVVGHGKKAVIEMQILPANAFYVENFRQVVVAVLERQIELHFAAQSLEGEVELGKLIVVRGNLKIGLQRAAGKLGRETERKRCPKSRERHALGRNDEFAAMHLQRPQIPARAGLGLRLRDHRRGRLERQKLVQRRNLQFRALCDVRRVTPVVIHIPEQRLAHKQRRTHDFHLVDALRDQAGRGKLDKDAVEFGHRRPAPP